MLREWISTKETEFTTTLQAAGWSRDDIADEVIGLATAGWESTAAAVTSGVTIGLGPGTTDAEISELLRLYPPSWLLTRLLRFPENPAKEELLVICPWLIHRNTSAWTGALVYDASRFPSNTPMTAYLPFGAGPRRCPADRYARAQISAALSVFGGNVPEPGQPQLIGRRSAALVPEPKESIL